MQLYYTPGACSINPHIALIEIGANFELVKVDLRAKTLSAGSPSGEAEGGSFLDVNPKGYVPALRIEGGDVLTENLVMAQFIADLKPESKLAPANGTMARIRLAEMLTFISTELHKGISPFYNPAANDEFKAAIKDRLGVRWAYLSNALGDKTWLFGDDFTIADSYAFYVLRSWKYVVKADFPTPSLEAYYARLSARPSIVQALEAEGLPA